MRKSLIVSSLVVSLMSPVVLAKRDPDVNRALKKEYPDATTEVIDVRTVNGVKVSDVKVTTKRGECMAKVTEYGDFVEVGEPRGGENVSREAVATLNGLFKEGQSDVDCYRVTSYLVDVKTDKKWFRLRFDPVGEIHDIYNEADMKKDEIKNLEKVDRKDHADKADDYARKYIEGAKVEGVYKYPDDDDFFIVDMKQKDGKDARITLTNVGRILDEREEIRVNDIPKPVLDGMDQMFDRTKIVRAFRYEYEYYQFDKTTNAGDRVNIKIRTNGDVISVHNEGLAKLEAEPKKKK
jgi:hypothetical protein